MTDNDTDTYADKARKAQRLDDVHAWLTQRFQTAYRQGDVINEQAAIETLYLVETGLKPEDNREAVDDFRDVVLANMG